MAPAAIQETKFRGKLIRAKVESELSGGAKAYQSKRDNEKGGFYETATAILILAT
jgi:hypothetical protein